MPQSLKQLLEEPKGKEVYRPGEDFLLYVFWEAPNKHAAEKVLDALSQCGAATHRDTPCVPTYHFRVSSLNDEITSKGPKTVGEHPQLKEAKKKLKVGVPRMAVELDLKRRGIDSALLDKDENEKLPEILQEDPVMLEFSEVYLDERAFYEHAGSKDYLESYGRIMEPGLQIRVSTVRLGTPTTEIAEKILVPMLREKVAALPEGGYLFKPLSASPVDSIVLCIDATAVADVVISKLPETLIEKCATCVGFAHPLKEERTRVMCTLITLPDETELRSLAQTNTGIGRVEIYCQETQRNQLKQIIERSELDKFCKIGNQHSGYAIHQKAHIIQPQDY